MLPNVCTPPVTESDLGGHLVPAASALRGGCWRQSPPFPCALVSVRIEEVRDHAAAGVQFTGPRYAFHPGKEHRKGVEQAVYAELKGPTPTI